MISIECELCEKELNEPGALMFSPPYSKSVDKSHFCKKCFELIREACIDIKDELNEESKK